MGTTFLGACAEPGAEESCRFRLRLPPAGPRRPSILVAVAHTPLDWGRDNRRVNGQVFLLDPARETEIEMAPCWDAGWRLYVPGLGSWKSPEKLVPPKRGGALSLGWPEAGEGILLRYERWTERGAASPIRSVSSAGDGRTRVAVEPGWAIVSTRIADADPAVWKVLPEGGSRLVFPADLGRFQAIELPSAQWRAGDAVVFRPSPNDPARLEAKVLYLYRVDGGRGMAELLWRDREFPSSKVWESEGIVPEVGLQETIRVVDHR